MAATGREWLDIVVPEEEDGGDKDDYGNRHAFEWALRKKPDGDCSSLQAAAAPSMSRDPASAALTRSISKKAGSVTASARVSAAKKDRIAMPWRKR